jgi:hypothetical protein
MIWLSILSLAAGALLAQRFKVIVLAPAILAFAIGVVGAGAAQGDTVRLMFLKIVAAIVGTQAGYFGGMLMRHALGGLLARSSRLPRATSARDSAR